MSVFHIQKFYEPLPPYVLSWQLQYMHLPHVVLERRLNIKVYWGGKNTSLEQQGIQSPIVQTTTKLVLFSHLRIQKTLNTGLLENRGISLYVMSFLLGVLC